MGIFEQFPYTNMQNINLDWVLSTVRNLSEEWLSTKEEWTATRQEFDELESFIRTYFEKLNLQEEVNKKIDEMFADGTLKNIINELFSEFENSTTERFNAVLNQQNSDIKVLESRMDTFASLTQGSTTGDAELKDIRVGYNGIIHPTAGDAVREQIEDVLSLYEGIYSQENVEFIKQGDIETSIFLGANLQWFSGPYNKNTVLNSLIFKVPAKIDPNPLPSFDITIKIWEVEGSNIISKNKIIVPITKSDAGTTKTVSLGAYLCNNAAYISYSQGRSIISYTAGTAEKMKFTRETGNTLALDSLQTFDGLMNITIYSIVQEPIYLKQAESELHVGKGLDFEDVQSAIESSKPGDTIVIHPGIYSRFSTIRKLTDPYPWENANIRNINIIGYGKGVTIIKDDSGNYDTPPAEIEINGTVSGITFIATHEQQSPDAKQGSYAVHIDAKPLNNTGFDTKYVSCEFISYQASGVGAGTHANTSLTFDNCDFVSFANPDYNPHEGYINLAYLGSFTCHASTDESDKNQYLTLNKCKCETKHGAAFNIPTNTNCTISVSAQFNTTWSEEKQTQGYLGSYAKLTGDCFGNQSPQLNK